VKQLFEIGQMVAYGIHGVCRIVGTEIRKIDKKNVEYFVLEPIRQPGSYYYIPTQNEKALAKLRDLITVEQLKDVLDSDCYCWIDDENKRKQNYRDLITNAGCSQLLSAIRVLEKYKKEQFEAGKKFHQCDENFLRDAERLVFEELSVVLELDISKVPEYLHSVLQNV
jgi:CarD family transcriptional regulator